MAIADVQEVQFIMAKMGQERIEVNEFLKFLIMTLCHFREMRYILRIRHMPAQFLMGANLHLKYPAISL